jgi:sec-independent protein translocase protein TatA
MGTFQPWHLLVIAIVGAFLFFGWKNLPDMARSAGRSLRVFKTEIKGMGEDDKARGAREEAAEPKQLEARPPVVPQPKATPQAEVVRRPRPSPSPNGPARRG